MTTDVPATSTGGLPPKWVIGVAVAAGAAALTGYMLLPSSGESEMDVTNKFKAAEVPQVPDVELGGAQEIDEDDEVEADGVEEKDRKLSELDQRTDLLQEGASQFQTQVCYFINLLFQATKMIILHKKKALNNHKLDFS